MLTPALGARLSSGELLTPAPARAWLAVGALGAFGTGVAYVLQYGLIRDAGAAAAVTYFIPIASVLLGALVLGERPSWGAPLGAALVVAGALIARPKRDRRGAS